jgi:NAD(P)-dependent dehydrogenase (short-subunit alcohol dehydrogenase family)
MNLQGKIALVTGSERGIGKGIALKLAEHGADMVVNYVWSQPDAEEVCREIEGMGRKAFSFRADVSRSDEVRALFAKAVHRFGTLDILVNNAGIGVPNLVEDITEEEWNRVLGVNLTGVFLCCQEAARIMKPRKKGKIVNIASISGIKMATYSGVHYTVAKAGVIALTRHIGFELAPYGIHVNAVCPGAVLTPLMQKNPPHVLEKMASNIPTGRITTIEDQADAVLFLASDFSNSIVGTTLVVDGGSLLGWQSTESYERAMKKARKSQ